MKKLLFITIMLAGTASAAFASTGRPVDLENMYGDVEIVNFCSLADWCVRESYTPHLQIYKTVACSRPGEWNFVNAAAKFRIHMGCVTPDFEIAFGPYAEITSEGRRRFGIAEPPHRGVPPPRYVSPKKPVREPEPQKPLRGPGKPAKGDPKKRFH